MALHQEPPHKKVRIGDGDNVEEEIEEAVPIPVGPMKITDDILFDCLEKVFSYLDPIDLFNVADSNALLREAAQLAFKMSKIKTVMLHSHTHWNAGLEMLVGYLWIKGLKYQLRFLRYFGDLVSNIEVGYDNVPANKRQYLDQYINEYCADTLIELRIWNCDENTVIDLKKPFENVKKVLIDGSKLCDMVKDLNKWFPKMRDLILCGTKDDDSDIEKVELAIRSNQQLRSLSITSYWSRGIFQCISELPELNTLSVEWNDKFVEQWNTDHCPIHVKNIKEFSTGFNDSSFPMQMMPFTFEKLEELSLPMVNLDDFLEFFTKYKHPTIKIVRVEFDRIEITEVEVARLNNAFPSLAELNVSTFYQCVLTIDEALLFTTMLTALKTFTFLLEDFSDWETGEDEPNETIDGLLKRFIGWQGTCFCDADPIGLELVRNIE